MTSLMKWKEKMKIYLLTIIFLMLMPLPAHATLFGFYNITNNNAGDAAIGEAQLFCDVTDAGGGQVLFGFINTGPELSSIADVYFDDGALLGIASIDNSDPGVSFSQLASPPNLPGGNNASPPFVTTAGFLADSDPPTQPNGVNPDEWLGIYFDLQSGKVFDNVIGDLATGALRIGIHVQGFESGGSESFINVHNGNGGNGNPVPEPATMLLLGSGLVALAGLGRRYRK